MRVIAGSAGGTRLKVPRGMAVRPTSDRVKEALFSILGARVCETVVWDLFAGSGAIGIEALSRGAAECVFVEKNRRHLGMINENLARTGLAGRARLIGLDVGKALSLLSREERQADLIFLDPPTRRQMCRRFSGPLNFSPAPRRRPARARAVYPQPALAKGSAADRTKAIRRYRAGLY